MPDYTASFCESGFNGKTLAQL